MRTIAEYEAHAAECRKLAGEMSDPVHKKQLEEIAQAWAMLADERRKQLLIQANGHGDLLNPESNSADEGAA